MVGSLEGRLHEVQDRIVTAAERAGRSAADITLVAVGKGRALDRLVQAWHAGVRDFGENRVQEAKSKLTAWDPALSATWHLIGHLQTNKARDAAKAFEWIHSIDSLRVARAIDRAADQRAPQLLLEVNYGREANKFGFDPAELAVLLPELAALSHVRILGLMTVAPVATMAEDVRPVFRGMRELRDRLAEQLPRVPLPHLSMGMSGDFEVAIEEGATMVRIGSAIFGALS